MSSRKSKKSCTPKKIDLAKLTEQVINGVSERQALERKRQRKRIHKDYLKALKESYTSNHDDQVVVNRNAKESTMSSKSWKPAKISGNTLKEKIASWNSHVRRLQAKKRKQFDKESQADYTEQCTLEQLAARRPEEKNNVPQYLNKIRGFVDLALEANKRQSKNQLRELALAFRELDVSTNLLHAWEHARGISCAHVIAMEERIRQIKSNWKNEQRKRIDESI